MNSRFRILPGAILLALGAAAVATSSRVLSTFVLELVVQTLDLQSAQSLEPYEFSWGTMYWGRMPSDYSILCAGLLLIAVGQLLVLPPAIRRINILPASKLPKIAMIGASILTLLSAASFLLIPIFTMNAFGTLATTGVADPVSLAEDLPIRSNGVFKISLVAAQLLILIAALSAPNSATRSASPAGRVLPWASCACLFLFAAMVAYTRLGPIRTLADFESLASTADPAMIAGQINLALKVMLFATPLLAASAALSLLAALLSPTSCTSGHSGEPS
jgi:hypothetical protein